MNLLDRVIDNQLLDLNITSQLSDISYRTNNGIKQKNRNFAEGIVDSGKINFNDAKDKITKDMILEYQQEQQEIKPVYVDPISGDQKLYYPSVYKLDPNLRSTVVPINLSSTGAPSTQQDVNDVVQNDLNPELMNYAKIEQEIKDDKRKLENAIHDDEVYKEEKKRLEDKIIELNRLDAEYDSTVLDYTNKIKINTADLVKKPTTLKSFTKNDELEKANNEMKSVIDDISKIKKSRTSEPN